MAITSFYSPTSKETLIAGFPKKIQSIQGDPALRGLIMLFRHMIECSQNKCTIYSILNWLFLAFPVNIRPLYAPGTVYPVNPQHQRENSSCVNGNEALVGMVQHKQGPNPAFPCTKPPRTLQLVHVRTYQQPKWNIPRLL